MRVSPADCEITAFCPGQGMGLFQFKQMPFGLSGAPSSFQRLTDKMLQGLPFVAHYIDDILLHSADEHSHHHPLQEVFERLEHNGLTLRGKKCQIGRTSLSYLGHIFSGLGMSPDPQRAQSIQEWPTPMETTAVSQFLGLASYCQWYIHRFSDIAAPLLP